MLSDPDPWSFCALFEVLNHDDVLNEVAFFFLVCTRLFTTLDPWFFRFLTVLGICKAQISL
jgi:hypothetical protein